MEQQEELTELELNNLLNPIDAICTDCMSEGFDLSNNICQTCDGLGYIVEQLSPRDFQRSLPLNQFTIVDYFDN